MDLIELNKSLFQLSKRKTDKLKEGLIEQVQDLLSAEQKHIQAINKLEKSRLEAVRNWADHHQLSVETRTVTDILEHLSDPTEVEQLEKQATDLAEVLVDLKGQEYLNQQLTEQSMQFVQMNLAMLSPTIEQINYGKKHQQAGSGAKRSVFDSKA